MWIKAVLSCLILFLTPVYGCEMSSIDCLARNIYFEARGESTLGKVAVGLVTLNRARNPRWHTEICSIVWEEKQFSWTHDGKLDIPLNMEAFLEAWLIASAILSKESSIIDFTKNATHYHSDKVAPYWSHDLEYVTQIGGHKFYK